MNLIKVNYFRNGKPTSTTIGWHVASFWAEAHQIPNDKIREYLQEFTKNQSVCDPIQGKQDLEARLLADTIIR